MAMNNPQPAPLAPIGGNAHRTYHEWYADTNNDPFGGNYANLYHE